MDQSNQKYYLKNLHYLEPDQVLPRGRNWEDVEELYSEKSSEGSSERNSKARTEAEELQEKASSERHVDKGANFQFSHREFERLEDMIEAMFQEESDRIINDEASDKGHGRFILMMLSILLSIIILLSLLYRMF